MRRTRLRLSALPAARGTLVAPMPIDRVPPVGFARLTAESRRVATALWRPWIRRDDRVALWLSNVSAWLSCFFACARLGAIAISVKSRFGPDEALDLVGRSGTRLLVTRQEFKGIDFSSILAEVAPAAPAQVRLAR